MELHADFQLVDTFKHVATQHGDQLGVELAIGLFRLDGYFDVVTGRLAFQRLFQARNDIAGTVQVNQRRTTDGRIQHFAIVIGQGVVDGHGLVGGNLHNLFPVIEGIRGSSVRVMAPKRTA